MSSNGVEYFDVTTAKNWFRLIEDGIPDDISLERFTDEALSSNAPDVYQSAFSQSVDDDDYDTAAAAEGLTEAEYLAIRMETSEGDQLYITYNEDCRRRNWQRYTVYSSLLHSICMKLWNKPRESRPSSVFSPENLLYRGVSCAIKYPPEKQMIFWPCFTSATPAKVVALEFGDNLLVIDCEKGAPVKEFSEYKYEYEILFSPFNVFYSEKNKILYDAQSSAYFISWPFYRGALLGSAVANCLGSRFEFINDDSALETVLAFFDEIDKKNVTFGSCIYTCDTSMTMALAKSLTGKCALDVADVARCLIAEYSDNPYRNYGSSVVAVIQELKGQNEKGDPFAPAKKLFGRGGSHGNGGAMRIAPAALRFYHSTEKEFIEVVRQITSLTHSHVEGIHGAILQAVAVQLAIKYAMERLWQTDIRSLFLKDLTERMKKCLGSNNPYMQKLQKIKNYLNSSPTIQTIQNELGNGISALQSVPTAIYCFLRGIKDIPEIPSQYTAFERTIIYSICLGGDTDTIASMAGAIAGAYYGQDRVPQKWRDVCEKRAVEETKQYAKKIHEQTWKLDYPYPVQESSSPVKESSCNIL